MNDRQSNPFATKFVSAGRLAFAGLDENMLNRLAETLIQQNGHGQIIGAHGVGKTTLTYELEKRVMGLCEADSTFKFVRKTIGTRGRIRSANSTGQVELKEGFAGNRFQRGDSVAASVPIKTVLVLDGIGRMSWFQRLALIRSCQQKQIGLLVTSHHRVRGVKHLVTLAPDVARFESVFKTLTSDCEFQLSPQRLSEIFSDNDGNMREALMSCYDEFEASRAKTFC